MKMHRRLITLLPLAALLAVIIIIVILNFVVWVFAGSGPIQGKLNRVGDSCNSLCNTLERWAR